MKNKQNTTEAVEVLQEWRDANGNVDLDAVRSGMVDVRHRDAIMDALLDEVEQARADRALMAAVLDTIDVPSPATIGDEDAYHRTLALRSMAAAVALRDTLSGEFSHHDVPVMTKFLRRRISDFPVNYTVVGGES